MTSKAARVALLSLATIAALLDTACSGTVDEEDADSVQEAISTLAASDCKKPVVRTSQKDESGRTVDGVAHTTLQGCVVGSAGETGTAVVGRVAAILEDTQTLSKVEDTEGKKVFAKIKAGRAKGSLETRITQDIEVTLAMDNSPTTTLHIEQRKTANGNYVIDITNATALKAAVAFFTSAICSAGSPASSPRAPQAATTDIGSLEARIDMPALLGSTTRS